MSPVKSKQVLQELDAVSTALVESGLADDVNFAYAKGNVRTTLTVETCDIDYAWMLKERNYRELYLEQVRLRSFAAKLLDGGLLQMSYEFVADSLMRARLAYLPSPDLLDFENHPDLYDEEALFADIVEVKDTIVPLRFDFDNRPGIAKSLVHPVSHLTLGQFTRCRIASTAPLGPWLFVGFILRCFYSAGIDRLKSGTPSKSFLMAACITPEELGYVHIGVPASP